MKYPWANVLLLLLGTVELATGFLGLVWGTADSAIALHVHRAAGFGIVALLVWKGRNVIPSLSRVRRWKRFPWQYAAFTFALGLLLTALVLGLTWSVTGPFYFLNISGVSWHIYVSMPIIPLVLWHVIFHRRSLTPRFWAQRRSFLHASAIVISGLLMWRLTEAGTGLLGLPGSNRRFTGSYNAGDFSGNDFPSTSWLNDNPSPIPTEKWLLKVTGRVERQITLTYPDLETRANRATATLDCTGGWHSTQEWEGIPLQDIMDMAGIKPDAASVTVRSVTGYYRRFSMKEAGEYLLATRVGGEALSHAHGFPLRLVAPGKRGYDWIKWVTAVEVNDTSKWLQPPLPLQ